MADSQGSSALPSAQPRTIQDQQTKLLAEFPQLLATVEIFLPLARTRLLQLAAGPVSIPLAAEVEGWTVAVCLAEDSLGRIKPAGHTLVRYLLDLEAVLAKQVQQ